MRYCFDIDNTICDTSGNDYYNSVPRISIINYINNLFNSGNYIIIMSARGKNSGINWENFTKKQLNTWGIKYHELLMNIKPNADVFIDDKAINVYDWISNSVNVTSGIVAGAFDLIHPGYIRLFKFCKTHCTELTVAVHENPNLERNHKKIPILTLEERIEVLNSIKEIDKIVTYKTENDYISLLTENKYDVRFLGSEYKDSQLIITGNDLAPIVYHTRNHDWSYSNLCKKIVERDLS